MPRCHVNGADLHYVDTGPGSTGETVAFSHGLLWSHEMFAAQIARLAGRYRCIAWDHRGQGRSGSVRQRAIPIEQNYDDALALLTALDTGPVHLVGLSMGGFVALRLAARRPDLVRSLTVLASSAAAEPRDNVARYRALSVIAGALGPRPLAGRVMPIMFGETFLTDDERAAERREWRDRLVANGRRISRAVRGVVAREGVEDEVARIVAPTLVAVGEEDLTTPAERAEQIRALIPDARLALVPNAGHTVTVEAPDAVSDLLESFLHDVSVTNAN